MAKTHRFIPTRPVEPHVITAEVISTQRCTPHMQRVTVGGPELRNFTYQGFDQWFRLFLPRKGQESLQLPTSTSALWYAQYLLTSRERRPLVRNYTVRAWREDDSERQMDIDFVVHGDGPAASFALHAEPGDKVGILDQGLGYEAGRSHTRNLLVADESGLPAVLGIINSAPHSRHIEAFIEVPSQDDRQAPSEESNANIHWIIRSELDTVPGQAVLAAVIESGIPTEDLYAYAVGEQALAVGVRRYLVNERGVPKNDISFIGYWRHGRSSPS